MGFELKQQLKLGQNLLMTPALQQAIKLLQLSRMELEQFVAEQLAENPILEEGGTDSNDEIAIAEAKEKEATSEQAMNDHFDQIAGLVEKTDEEPQWELFSKNNENTALNSIADKNAESVNYENIISRDKTLSEVLLGQLGEVDLDEQEKKIGNEIIGNIDEKGYLKVTTKELSEQLAINEESIEDILDTIQRFEPNGVGARTLTECLLIQLRNSKLKNGTVEKIVETHLSLLENRNYDLIAKKMGITLDEVLKNVEIISLLEPVPGRSYSQENLSYVIPDVYIYKIGEEWRVSLNQDGLPRLKVNNYYSSMIDQKSTKSTDKEYLQNKLKDANWLIKSIEQRQKTILKVAKAILDRQLDFFEKGVEHLKPMILKDVSNDIEMHESTVSRVTNNKYLHSPRGIFELKYFFNSSVSRFDGEDVASESVKKIISDFIKTEDVKKPFSDQKIVEHLESQGIQLARRTVAKYREGLKILPSSKRKKYY